LFPLSWVCCFFFWPVRDWEFIRLQSRCGLLILVILCLGGLRALAQTIPYEVRLAFILLSFVVLISGYDLLGFHFFSVLCLVNSYFFSVVFCLIYFLFGGD
jgi:hypothetical protein